MQSESSLASHVLAWLRLVLAFAVSVWFYSGWVVGRVFAGGSEQRALSWRTTILRGWGRTMARVIGMRIEQRGPPPPPGSLIVCNHVAWTDILLLHGLLGVTFVSKEEVARWPLAGRMTRGVGTIFVPRAEKRRLPEINALIEAALARGERVALFPEGTTSSDGESVMPFRPALLEPAARSRYPVFCGAIRYRTPPGSPPASQVVGWSGGISFLAHALRLFRLPFFFALVEFDGEPLHEEDRKRLAERTWSIISRLVQSPAGREDRTRQEAGLEIPSDNA